MINIKFKKGFKPPPPKRKPGEKAGLTRASIVAQALKLRKQGHDLNVQAIAKSLGVAPAAVYSHFPGKLSEIQTEMVRAVLKDAARPLHPNESWEAYLQDLFAAVLEAFRKHPNTAVFFSREIAENYYLNSLLVERILFALNLAGLSVDKRTRALDLVFGSLIGLVTIECLTPKSDQFEGLTASEHPQIMITKGHLMKAAQERSSEKPSSTRAKHFSDVLIAGLKTEVSAV